MEPHQFKATPEEIELAECIQRTIARKSTEVFSIDAARRILKESGLLNGQIREICTIADLDGDGKLSNQELCAVVRLAGWAQQQGIKLSESLLATAGPLPVLKGSYAPRDAEDSIYEPGAPYHSGMQHDLREASEILKPQRKGVYHHDRPRDRHQSGPKVVYPLITVAHMETCRRLFERAGPINGLMDRQTAEEVLISHLDAPFLLLKTILSSNRLSLNILEFTLAAYFVEGLQSRTIKSLPSAVPDELYDQLWSPILLTPPPISEATVADECKFDSVASAEQSPATSAQSSTSDLGSSTAPRLSPVRKEPQCSYSTHCPSISSVETKHLSKVWKRVAKHCQKIEKLFKVSPTRYRKDKRQSIFSSDVSVKGTVCTNSSESSFEALERDSSPQLTSGQRASMDIVRLPFIYPTNTGYYASPDPEPLEIRNPTGVSVNMPDNVTSYSSDTYEESVVDSLGDNPHINLREELANYQAGGGELGVTAEKEATSALFSMVKDMKEEYTFLRLQIQIMQKTIQKLELNRRPTEKIVRFASDTTVDLGGRVRDSIQIVSGVSRRTQSLKISKELAGPRDMLSTKGGSSFWSSSSRQAYGRSHPQHRRGESELVLGPRVRDRHRESSSISSLGSLYESESTRIPKAPDYRRLPEIPDDRANDTPTLRSILKMTASRQQTEQCDIIDHNTQSSSKISSPTAGLKQGKQPTKRSGMTEEALQAWNARFIPVDRVLETKGGISVPKQLRKLPRTPRRLPTPATAPILPKCERSRILPPLPMASSSKFPGAWTDKECSASTSHNDSTTDSFDMAFDHGDMDTETAPSSAASTLRSSGDFSSIFSRRYNSARTSLLTEIDEYNETVVRDLREAAPELVLQLKKCLLRELRTESDKTHNHVYDDIMVSPQSPLRNELEEALSQLRAKEEELQCLEDTHFEVLKELTKLEQEKQKLQWTLVDQEELNHKLREPTVAVVDLSVELPEYTPRW